MKKVIFGIILLFALMAAIPAMVSIPKADLSAVFASSADKNSDSLGTSSAKEKAAEKQQDPKDSDSFLLLEENGSKTAYSKKEMLSGAIAAKMPQAYSEESAKALAAALYSQLCYMKENRKTTKLQGADLAKKDGGICSFLTKQEACERYGGDFYEKCEQYAEFAIKTSITKDRKRINALVFGSCGGSTESAAELYPDKALPYCQSVSSPWDIYGNINSEKEITDESAKKILSEKFNITEFPDDISDYIKIKSTAQNGTVLNVEVCGKNASGIDIMNSFSLKSPCFETECDENKIRFKVVGDGIPVGMSITGAEGMAKQGAEWSEILSHYFIGCEIK